MRPLLFDFPDDGECTDIGDQFMFGDKMLVAPILEEGARTRRVYLPRGDSWTDAWTGETLLGGVWIDVEAPMEKVPFFYRGGIDLGLVPS